MVNHSKDYLVPFDATSLYPSAMHLDSIYPVLSSAKLMTEEHIITTNTGIEIDSDCFYVEVDIYIPKDLTFVPISYKDNKQVANFKTGNIPKIVVNHCDVSEFKKFGIIITKFHQGITFTET